MAKAEWGVKRMCPGCGARFYDMRKNPPVCPSCKTAFDPEALLRQRRRSAPEEVKVKKPEVVKPAPEDDIEEGEVATEDAVIEDAAELGDEDSELEDVVDIAEEEGQAS
ncbi:MAG: TIGR02300 family protein [Alphaproteobacteria bacterium]|nr:TIGR02300 family protein [Alphaproteobacteria bacterium]